MDIRTTVVSVIDKLGDIDITCSARPEAGRIWLHLDGDDWPGCLRVQVYAANERLICERLVRSLPGSLEIALPARGRYDLLVGPIDRNEARKRCLTWSDWDAEVSGANVRRYRSAAGEAVLLVA